MRTKTLKPIQGGTDRSQLPGYNTRQWLLAYGETDHPRRRPFPDQNGAMHVEETNDVETLCLRNGLGEADPESGAILREPGLDGHVLIFPSRAEALKFSEGWPAKYEEFVAKAKANAAARKAAEDAKKAEDPNVKRIAELEKQLEAAKAKGK
jgi:hypothetical protein